MLIVLVDWEGVRGNQFPDVANYLYKIETIRWRGVEYFFIGETWIDYLKNEYAWFFFLYLIAKSSLDPILALKIVSGFCAFVYHRFLANGIGNILAFVFLLNPIIIDLLASQMRGAFAFSIFLVAVMLVRHRMLFYAVTLVLCFVHSAMFVLSPIYFTSHWLANIRGLKVQQKIIIAAGLAVGFALLIVTFAPIAMSTIGDRRNYDDASIKSVLYVTFWLAWGVMLIFSMRSRLDIDWAYLYAIFICVSVPIMTVLGFPSFRLLAISLPVVLLRFKLLAPKLQLVAGSGMLLYQVILFGYWIS